jgi:hypothetical protein
LKVMIMEIIFYAEVSVIITLIIYNKRVLNS